MTKDERTGKPVDESEDEPMVSGWSARWDAQALGEVRSKTKTKERTQRSAQEDAS